MGPHMRQFLRDLLLGSGAIIASWFDREALTGVWRAFEDSQTAGGLSRYQRLTRFPFGVTGILAPTVEARSRITLL